MLRNIATVARGTLFAQLIGVAVLPLLTRLFDPTAFGHLQLYQSILTVLIILPSLRYDVALLRADPEELSPLLVLCVGANVAAFGLLWLALEVGGLAWPTSPIGKLPFPAWALAAAVMLAGISQVFNYLAIRGERFSVNANSRVVQALGYSGASVGLGLARAGSAGLIFADLFSRLVNLAWLMRWFRGQPVALRSDLSAVRTVAVRYREYPLMSLPGSIVNSIGGALTPVMVYATFSASFAGQYGLVERALSLPVALLVIAISQVYASRLGLLLREGQPVRAHFHRLLRWTALCAVVPALVLMVAAPPIFALVFGPQWELAGWIAQLMAIAYFFTLLSGVVNMTLTVVGAQTSQFLWEVGRLAGMAVVWTCVPIYHLSLETAVALHVGTVSLSSMVFLLLCEWAMRRHDRAQESRVSAEEERATITGGDAR